MGWFDKLKQRAIENSHTGGPTSIACANVISRLEKKRIERKLKKMEGNVDED